MHKQTTPRKPCANHPICHRRRIRHRGALAATGFQERVRSEFHCRFQAQWERRAGLVTSKCFPGQDLIAAAEVKPDSISIAGSGLVNSANHVANVRLEGAAGIKLTYVPFKGTGDLVASLLA